MEERPVPLWQKITAGVYLVVLVALVAVFRNRIGPDFWPLDSSRVGPNLVASVVTVLFVTPFAYLLWPPVRRRIHRAIARHTAPLHDEFAEVHRKLDHVILHSKDVPPLPPS